MQAIQPLADLPGGSHRPAATAEDPEDNLPGAERAPALGIWTTSIIRFSDGSSSGGGEVRLV
ncbi:hypothetical protein C8F04DRAFT_1262293 [Mycena alexandri]|uniref:Uncharacterized protein n=1 Tax=Mycena alexandri TaxID=1745969 RepID=A0AAD6ST63_9AGAR|nr:hypothetical protein C8F04DRAFT_1262293 [Mycena alexandri]